MKKILSVIVCVILVLSLAACAQTSQNIANQNTANQNIAAQNVESQNDNNQNNSENAANSSENIAQNEEKNAGNAASILSYLGLDFEKETVRVKSTAEVAVLQGSWHDMGYQYAQQASESVRYLIGSQLSGAVAGLGSYEAVYANVPEYEKMLKDAFPTYLDFVKGVFDGLSDQGYAIAYNDVLVGFMSITADTTGSYCMAVSAWGEATEDGKTYAAMHSDSSHQAVYTQPVIVAYPEDGHAFISAVGFTNAYLNDAGLVCMITMGYGMADGDNAPGLPICIGALYNAAYASTSDEAVQNHIDKCRVGSGEIAHYTDEKGNGAILETTAAHYAVRKSGDKDEKDYLLQSNDWESDEMQSSLPIGVFPDNMYRYDTAKKYIDENIGKITMDTLRNALSQTSYYDAESGEMVYNWSEDPDESCFSPENKDPKYGCVMRRVMDLENRTMYIMMGSEDTLISKVPGSTGTFAKITLGETPEATMGSCINAARKQVWYAARDLDGHREKDEDISSMMTVLDDAREAVFTALNYQVVEGASIDTNEKLSMCAKSMTYSVKAQCLAKTLRDGDIADVIDK